MPGQPKASMGRSYRTVEAVDIFPTLTELLAIPTPPRCPGIDAPPTVQCVQGESYATLFDPSIGSPYKPKQYAYSQWPYPAWGPEKWFRMGYTVRSSRGYRLTEYVPYNQTSFQGDWSKIGDIELYDYNVDPWETTNYATNSTYTVIITELRAALRAQYHAY